MDNYKLSEHFSFYELTNTSHGDLVLANRLDAKQFEKNLKYTAHALEEVRAVLGFGLAISSGYRNNALNTKVGGSKTSKHTQGLCADFQPVGMSVKDAFNKLTANKDKLHSVRKVIVEGVRGKEWIHLQAKVLATEEMEFYATSDGKNYTKVG